MADCFLVRRGGAENAASSFPEFTYTGTYELIDDGKDGNTQNWRIKFLTSGKLTFTKVANKVDIFLVGAGGGSIGTKDNAASGGGGGYTKTYSNVSIKKNTEYSITVGAGVAGGTGGETNITINSVKYSASGGKAGTTSAGGNGGSGGGAKGASGYGGDGGSDGSDGGTAKTGTVTVGTGQHTTTREFGETAGKLYAGGGGGATPSWNGGVSSGGEGGGGDGGGGGNVTAYGEDGETNTGGGAGGGMVDTTYKGGSGILIIRNARAA